jgi:hypothetical protein
MSGADDRGDACSVLVVLRRVGSSGYVVETDPPGIVPEGMDVESAFMRIGSEMLARLSSTPRPREAARFARPRPRVREGS